MLRHSFLIAALVSSAATAAADDGTGLKTSVSVDMVGAFKANKSSQATDRFDIREAEFMLYAPVDQVFDGLLSAAAHREAGVSTFEVHEAVLSSSKLIPRSRLRVGQFFLGIGRLNRVHRHEWPFIFAPKTQLEFFGAEGALDSGAEYAFLAPVPFFLELTAGVTNGWTYGHTHNEGEKPRKPTHYGRVATYAALPADGGMQIGLNYLSRKTADAETTSLLGADMAAKWRRAGVLDVLLQGEVWQRSKQPSGARSERAIGLYLFPQIATSSATQVGLLYDYFTIATLQDLSGRRIANNETRWVPTITYRASEFSSLRLAYDWSKKAQRGQPSRTNQALQAQATFTLGAHPAHDF